MNIFRRLVSLKTPKKRVMWFQIPMDCNSREEKREVILQTIETLEKQINIINYE